MVLSGVRASGSKSESSGLALSHESRGEESRYQASGCLEVDSARSDHVGNNSGVSLKFSSHL